MVFGWAGFSGVVFGVAVSFLWFCDFWVDWLLWFSGEFGDFWVSGCFVLVSCDFLPGVGLV